MQDKTKIFSAVLIIMLCFLFLPSCPAQSAVTIYRRTNLLGGDPNDLDGIDGDDLAEGDIAWVYRDANSIETLYDYRLNATSGAAESAPDIIAPDTNPGSKRWILQRVYIDALHGLTASVAELNILDGCTATYAQINTVAVNGKYGTRGMLLGDTTAGRVMRASSILIEPGTDPNTVKCTVSNVWNGDTAAAEDNIAKGGSGTNFALDATGSMVSFLDAGITGTPVAIISADVAYNSCEFNSEGCYSVISSNNITFRFSDGSVYLDLTDCSTFIRIQFTYITSE